MTDKEKKGIILKLEKENCKFPSRPKDIKLKYDNSREKPKQLEKQNEQG